MKARVSLGPKTRRLVMTLGISLVQYHAIEERMAGSVFPQVEAKLRDSEYERAIKFIGRRKNMTNYFDLVDFIFCEVFTGFRGSCQAFYRGEGPSLRDHRLATEEKIKFWESVMIKVLEVSLQKLNDERWVSWGHVCEEAMEMVA